MEDKRIPPLPERSHLDDLVVAMLNPKEDRISIDHALEALHDIILMEKPSKEVPRRQRIAVRDML